MSVTSLNSSTAWPDLSPLDSFWDDLTAQYLLPYVNTCRWFAGKARPQTGISITHKHLITETTYLLTVGIRYADGIPESYLLPFAFAIGAEVDEVPEKGRIAEATFDGQTGWLVDGIYLDRFRRAIFERIAQNAQIIQDAGQLDFNRGKGLDASDVSLPSRVLPVDSSNSALVFGDKYFLKLYRKLFPEMNPEVEMVAFISENSDFAHIPAYAGSIVWTIPGGRSATKPAMITLGMMQRMVANDKDSWSQTGDHLNDFLYAVPNRLFTIREDVFDRVELLGKRTAQMHSSLYQPTTTDDAFAPEPFTDEYRAFLIQRFKDLLERRYTLLIDNYTRLDPLAQRLAWIFMEAKEMIDEFVDDFRTRPLESLRIRIHGDYHLGQVLAVQGGVPEPGRSGGDFVIIDFEGEPESSITERKIKHSPLKDVAGMIRSYHYAVSAKLFTADETANIEPGHLQRVSERWFKLIRDTYLDAYLAELGSPHPLFKNNAEINFLLLIYLLEKAVYELGYEISYRPTWVKIPLKGIIDVITEIEKIQLADPQRAEYLQRLQSGLLKSTT